MMMNVVVANNTNRKTIVIDGSVTSIRAAFEQADIAPTGLISINGVTLMAGEMDEMLETFVSDPSKKVWLNSVAKLDNACKIRVLDNVMNITSDLTVEEYDTLRDAASDDKLVFNDDEGEPYFAIGTGEIGSLTPYGIVYEVSADNKLKLTVPVEEGTKEALAREFGATLRALIDCEKEAKENVEAARAAIREVEDIIEIL